MSSPKTASDELDSFLLEEKIRRNLERQQILIDKLTTNEARSTSQNTPLKSTGYRSPFRAASPKLEDASRTLSPARSAARANSPERGASMNMSYRTRSPSPPRTSTARHYSPVRSSPVPTTPHTGRISPNVSAAAVATAGLSSSAANRIATELKALEMRELIADEESVALLKQQLVQIEQIRAENERKELLLSDLSAQIRELSRYKEEALQLKARCSVLDERVVIGEAENQRLKDELNEQIRRHESNEASLRSQISILEQTKADQQRKFADHEAHLERSLANTKDDMTRRINELSVLLEETTLSHKQTAEREARQIATNSELTSQLSNMTHQRNEVEAKYASLAGIHEKQSAELQDTRMLLSNERLETDRLGRELANTRETLRSVTDAHEVSSAHAKDLENQLQRARMDIYSLQRENAALKEREELEKLEREKFARARMDLIGMRNEAQLQLQSALDRAAFDRASSPARR